MITRYLKIIVLSFVCILSFVNESNAQEDIEERQIKVAMRMIGDQILLNSCDSLSRILAIEKEEGRYKIQFESGFEFRNAEMVTTINEIVTKTKIAVRYLVEVESCETKEVVYNYIMGDSVGSNMVPCQTRLQPKACYQLFITILEANEPVIPLLSIAPLASKKTPTSKVNYSMMTLLVISFLVLMGGFIYFRKKKNTPKNNPNIITIGQYEFDKKNRALSLGNEKTELSSKETDLLFLLYSSENKTLEREHILEVVWGNESDYIGRTLDVFISKLRKKLVADSNLKIVNIRGVGYKFVMNT